MKIRILSDLHLEWFDYDLTNDENADVLVLAGDILVIHQLLRPMYNSASHLERYFRFDNFLSKCNELFKHTIYVTGNHELYWGEFSESVGQLKTFCEKYAKIHILDNDNYIIDDIKFVGSTLWTNFKNRDLTAQYYAAKSMADFTIIHNKGSILTPEDTVRRFEESFTYLNSEVNTPDKVVVVTHHAPSAKSLNPKYKYSDINAAFINELDQFIEDNTSIKLWIHGHTHTAYDYNIGNTRVVCNPRGYMTTHDKEDTGWDETKMVEII